MPKLSIDNQSRVRAYLENMGRLYGVHVIISVCSDCGEWLSVKNGDGVHGISHTFCPACLEKVRETMKLNG